MAACFLCGFCPSSGPNSGLQGPVSPCSFSKMADCVSASLHTHRRDRQKVREVEKWGKNGGEKVSISLSGCCARCLLSGPGLLLHAGSESVCLGADSLLPPLRFGLLVSRSIIGNPRR